MDTTYFNSGISLKLDATRVFTCIPTAGKRSYRLPIMQCNVRDKNNRSYLEVGVSMTTISDHPGYSCLSGWGSYPSPHSDIQFHSRRKKPESLFIHFYTLTPKFLLELSTSLATYTRWFWVTTCHRWPHFLPLAIQNGSLAVFLYWPFFLYNVLNSETSVGRYKNTSFETMVCLRDSSLIHS